MPPAATIPMCPFRPIHKGENPPVPPRTSVHKTGLGRLWHTAQSGSRRQQGHRHRPPRIWRYTCYDIRKRPIPGRHHTSIRTFPRVCGTRIAIVVRIPFTSNVRTRPSTGVGGLCRHFAKRGTHVCWFDPRNNYPNAHHVGRQRSSDTDKPSRATRLQNSGQPNQAF